MLVCCFTRFILLHTAVLCAKTFRPKSHSELRRVEENAGLFEGDIVVPKEQLKQMDDKISVHDKLITQQKDFRWPTKVIPYLIDPTSGYSEFERAMIDTAVKAFERYTCLELVRRTNETDYIHVISERTICSSPVGYQGGVQLLKLGRNLNGDEHCMFEGTVQHEFMHALGFFHEQSRPDRDEYVTIIYDNVKPGMEGQFNKQTMSHFDLSKNPYDYNSIMHYDQFAFSKNNSPTVVPKKANVTIGQTWYLSPLDALKINNYYECDAPIHNPTSSGIAQNPCNFDNDSCAWIEDYKVNLYNTPDNDSFADDFDWVRTAGDSELGVVTPSSDHTTESGFYLLAPSYHIPKNKTRFARIRSPTVQNSNGTFCLTFYYFMNDAGQPEVTGILKCYVQNPYETQSRKELHYIAKAAGNGWSYAEAEGNAMSPFQFVFEAYNGAEFQSDIAIDDFYAYKGPCLDLTSSSGQRTLISF